MCCFHTLLHAWLSSQVHPGVLFAVVPQSQAAKSLSEQLKWRQRQADHGYSQVHVILDSRKLVSEKIPYSTWLHLQGWLRDD